jgi:hypothetical protein
MAGVAIWIAFCLLVVSLCAVCATAERQQIGEFMTTASDADRLAGGGTL